MSNKGKYFIKGTITFDICIDKTNISIKPSASFMSPEQKERAIAYPVKPSEGKALLIELDENKSFKLEIEVSMKEYLPALATIACQQKQVELKLSADGKTVVGFVFPTP